MIDIPDFRRLGLFPLLALALCSAGAAPAFAQEIAGAYLLLGDSDGTKPKTGARLELTFSGATAGAVKLFATRPGEVVRDTGTYSISDHRITIRFNEVDWAAQNQAFQFDGCTLTLPFKAVSATEGPGTSDWRKQGPECAKVASPSAPATTGRSQKLRFNPFSADEIITEDNQRRKIRVYAAENAVRTEGEESGETFITLMRFDRNLIWTLAPKKKTYAETAVSFGGGSAPLQEDPMEPGCSVVGEEQVGGYHCSKELCRVSIQGKNYRETRWRAKELDGLVIKYADNLRTLELENIKLGPQDPALFEIPAGYQKTSP
jgi:uncharacterized protein DUF4412